MNNAGRSQRALFAETPLEIDRQMFNINMFGTISLTKCVLPHIIERQQGHIVCTSSTAGKLGTCN
ncbi:SDR family NAD(P)-dependent oxidoreductase [Acinetobacter baumannii]|uniref:SDR family NAD(P)-dependent oxidoreductase n=1 Tax=Acinetobacter baumannii TaxID=470 RepID=UPI0034D40313